MAIDLSTLLRAYAVGLFPMSDDREANSIFWVEPEERAVMPLDGFHLSRSLRKTLRSDCFEVTADEAFHRVIELCAESAEDRPSTWINADIEQAFLRLHQRGLAHSIEVWSSESGKRRLVGGLYGLALGRAFFGESMFSRMTDASKIAMAWLVARLRVGQFSLLDCQFMTPHLASLGALEVSAERYSVLLGEALAEGGVALSGSFSALDALDAGPPPPDERRPGPATVTVSGPVSGHVIAQLLTQTS